MKVAFDADVLSTFVRTKTDDLLKALFDEIIVPPSVVSELARAGIRMSGAKPAKLSRAELLQLQRKMDSRSGLGERECLAIAVCRKIPLASNDKLVQEVCKSESVDHFNLPRLLRLAILKKAIRVADAKELVSLIEREERTVIKGKKEIFS